MSCDLYTACRLGKKKEGKAYGRKTLIRKGKSGCEGFIQGWEGTEKGGERGGGGGGGKGLRFSIPYLLNVGGKKRKRGKDVAYMFFITRGKKGKGSADFRKKNEKRKKKGPYLYCDP